MTILSGVTNTSGLNGHHGRYLDWRVPFLDKNSHHFEFREVPHVVATVDKGSAEDEISWSATILDVTKKDFGVRIRSVDMTREENPGWNGTVRIQWIAHLAD